MANSANESETVSIKTWMDQHLGEIIARIVTRSRQELPDYRNREVGDLRAGIEQALNSWYASIVDKDFALSRQNSAKAIEVNMEQGRDVEQILHTPVILCETVLEFLQATGQAVDMAEKTAFVQEAKFYTEKIIKIGRLQIANYAIDRATAQHKRNSPPQSPKK